VAVEAELKRRDPTGALIAWNLNADGTDPVADAEVRTKLGDILTELQQKLEPGGTVALDAATLAALETITASVANFPASYPLPTSQVTDLKTVTVSNPTADPETGLAKEVTLASVLAQLDDATTDTVLSVLKTLSGKDYATQATLASVLAAVDGLEAKDYATQATLATLALESTMQSILTKLTSIDDALNNTDSTTHAAVASVASGAWTDVVTLNRPNAITVMGFNADPDTLVTFDFRYRISVAGVVKISEVVSANRLSFIPVTIDVPANTDVKVQVRHGEIAAQDFQASIAYRE
jgi:hypothetical protein